MISMNSRTCALLWLCAACAAWAGSSLAVTAGPLPNNHELLTSLGLVRRRVAPGGHHRKRLAGAEMRSSAAPAGPARHDSHMVVIKLPPSQYYYANPKPVKADAKSANAINKVPLSFQGNGKPSGVYHWNIPVIKKMKSSGRGRHGGSSKRAPDVNGDSKIYHIQKNPPFTEHTSSRNDVLKGQDAVDAAASTKTQVPKNPKVSYYTPRRKTMFRKYFQGNGKPNSFYVIEKSKKPVHYHRLLP